MYWQYSSGWYGRYGIFPPALAVLISVLATVALMPTPVYIKEQVSAVGSANVGQIANESQVNVFRPATATTTNEGRER